MLEELNDRLMDVHRRMRQRDHLRSRQSALEQMLAEKQADVHDLDAVVEREQQEVDKLEGLSLGGLFHSILGDKREKLFEEKREVLEAKLSADACREELQPLQAALEEIDAELAAFTGLDEQRQSILQAKEQAIAASGSPRAAELLQLSEEHAGVEANQRELHEAVAAGRVAEAELDEVIKALKSAAGWGTWDMIGGGIISTAIKHSKIDKARAAAHRAQVALDRFRAELADVGQHHEISIDIGGFAVFADYFFDGLIADWFVQSKISAARQRVEAAQRDLRAAIELLRRSLDQCDAVNAGLARQRQELLEQA